MSNPKSKVQNPKVGSSKIQNPKSHAARLAAAIGVCALLLTCVPYLVGYCAAGKNHFLWLGGNIDDAAVYLSWMRQGETGSLHQFNRFTTDAQPGLFANPFFLLLGLSARVTHLPLVAVYHLARLGFGAGLLTAVWKFIACVIPEEENGEPGGGTKGTGSKDASAKLIQNPKSKIQNPNSVRLIAFTFVCFASGLGWLPLAWQNYAARATCPAGPIDLWQPEAITFLSLYLNPLFLCGMLLQVAIFTLLLKAERDSNSVNSESGNDKAEHSNGMKCAVAAGICGLTLSLVHTYDILTVAAVWTGYLIIKIISRRSSPVPPSSFLLPHSFVAGAIALPGVLLIASQLRTNKVFNARANVETLTAYPHWLLLGYGITFILACYALLRIWQDAKYTNSDPDEMPNGPGASDVLINGTDAALLLTIWPIVNIAVAYLPGVAFQRKLLQGAHFPIAILAGVGAALFIAKYQPIQNPKFRIQNGVAAGLLTILLGMTNLRFIVDETDRFRNNETKTGLHRPALLPGEVEAIDWIAANTPADSAAQALPWQEFVPDPPPGRHPYYVSDMTLPLFTPALANRAVYCGHWGETPDYAMRLTGDLSHVALGGLPDSDRIAILRRMNVQYLIFSQKDPADASADILFPQFRKRSPLPPYLTLIHSNPDADIYAIYLP